MEGFSGAYQVDVGGSISAPQSRAGPFHRIGRLLSDGEGHFAADTIANYGGPLSLKSSPALLAECSMPPDFEVQLSQPGDHSHRTARWT